MNALVKKEIRLLLPSWIAALLLALVQVFTRPYNFYIVSLPFFGLAIMALTTIGREASLNTFSSLLAQPTERRRIWQVKLTVLSAAFLTVLLVWLAAFGIAFVHSDVDASVRENSGNFFLGMCLLAAAIFAGGLWTTLLLRQIAGAFWLTLLVPAILASFSAIFFANTLSEPLVIAVLSVVIGTYSIAGFLFAHWLFFRAQDVGWSGGVISFPEWTFLSARAGTAADRRTRQPLFALLKKELLLQQGVLTGAAGLFVLNAASVALRVIHPFPKASVGAVVTSLFWPLWTILPVLIGSLAIAEERRLGVMEGQLCLPVSRNRQFLVKAFTVLGLGTVLGGVMPFMLEDIGWSLTGNNHYSYDPTDLGPVFYANLAAAPCLALASLFASSLAKNFLQAVGIALVTIIGWMMLVPFSTNGWLIFYAQVLHPIILPLFLMVPTLAVTLAWLAYLNFRSFREGWPLWRRQILGATGALLFLSLGSSAIYQRAWEVFEPAEPAHGLARLSFDQPTQLRCESDHNLLVRLPDGRVWFDFLNGGFADDREGSRLQFWRYFNPLPHSAGPQKFIAGSKWLAASARYVDMWAETGKGAERAAVHVTGYADSVGIQSDGILWASGKSSSTNWTANTLTPFGNDTHWRQFVRAGTPASVVLLKNDGTLWRWGTNHFDWTNWPQAWPGLRAFQPYQIGTNSDWTDIYWFNGILARKTDGSAWHISRGKDDQDHMARDPDYEPVAWENHSEGSPEGWLTYRRHNGTLWAYGKLHGYKQGAPLETLQIGRDTNWLASAQSWDWLVALRQDGTLWQWPYDYRRGPAAVLTAPPVPLGIHHDWRAITGVQDGVVALAADGGLWFWPNPQAYEYTKIMIQLPKQPKFLGNVFDGTE
jgi:hypothetical protein